MISKNTVNTLSFLSMFSLNSSDTKSLTLNRFSAFSMGNAKSCLTKQLQTAMVFKPKPQFVCIYVRASYTIPDQETVPTI